MNDASINLAQLFDLAAAQCEETLTKEQAEQLQTLVIGSPELRYRYILYMHIHALAENGWCLPASEIDPEKTKIAELPVEYSVSNDPFTHSPSPLLTFPFTTLHRTISFFSQELPFSLLIAAVLTSLGLWFASMIYVSNPEKIARDSSALPSNATIDPTLEIVGKITGMVDCKWADPQTETFHGANVLFGRKYALATGLMEITYRTGAKVILQGPCTYKVDSRDGGYLSIGKLTARLEKKQSAISGQQSEPAAGMANHKSEIINQKSLAPSPQPLTPNSNPQSPIPNPFVIRTPSAVVTDLGTEFGVEVCKSGVTFAHVYRGAVDVRANHTNSHGEAIRLAANESIEVRSVDAKEAPTVRRAMVDPSAFVRAEQFLRLAGKPKFKALRRWQDYMDKLRRDPELVVHYDFQKKDGSSNILHGVTRSSDSRLDGVIDGAVWADGRMPCKNALEFDGVNTRVKVKLPQRLTQMTIAAWVTIGRINDSGGTDYHGVASGLLMSEGWGKQGDSSEKCHWQITRAGEIYFGTPDHNVRTPEVLPWQQWSRNRWRHLAVAADPVHRQIACYLDGKQVLTSEFSERFAVAFNDATIGSWKTDAGTVERGLCGRMDDLVIFSRTMTTQEIQDMYEAGRP